MNLEVVPLSVKPPDKNQALADILIAVLQKIWLSCAQTSDWQKLWDDKYVLCYVNKFVVVCYSA